MLSVEPTAYDVKFSIFGIPVRIHPAFWIVGTLLGYQVGNFRLTMIWIVCLFVSILIHELGHALVARHFGWPPHILLYHFGGLAIFQPGYRYTRQRAILISLAGPGAGFVLFAIVSGFEAWLIAEHQTGTEWAIRLLQSTGDHQSGAAYAIMQLQWINLFWGIMNLLPVYPLDGGQVCSELLNARSSRRGLLWTHRVGMATGAAAALFFLNLQMVFAGLMFGGIAYDNFQKSQRLQGQRH